MHNIHVVKVRWQMTLNLTKKTNVTNTGGSKQACHLHIATPWHTFASETSTVRLERTKSSSAHLLSSEWPWRRMTKIYIYTHAHTFPWRCWIMLHMMFRLTCRRQTQAASVGVSRRHEHVAEEQEKRLSHSWRNHWGGSGGSRVHCWSHAGICPPCSSAGKL